MTAGAVTVLPRARVLPLFAGGVLVALEVAGMGAASAQTRTIHSLSVSTEAEHDSNPRMAVGDAPSTTWLRVRPTFTTRHVLGPQEYRLDASLSAERSSNPEVARNRLDPRVRGVWKRAGEVGATEIAVVLERRSLRSLDVAEQVPTGRDGSKTMLSVAASGSREVSERTAVGAQLRQDWERHSGGIAPDYRRTVGSARWTHQQTELRSWYAGVNGQAFHSDAPPGAGAPARAGTGSAVAGAVVGVSQQLGPAVRFDADAGVLEFLRPDRRGDWQSAFKAEYIGERWLAGLELSRTPGVSPGFDGLVVTQALRAHARHALDESSRIELQAGRARDKGVRSERTVASLALVRQWSPAWEISVRASRVAHQGAAGTARAHVFALLFAYRAADL